MTTSFEAAKAAMTPTEVLIAARKLCEEKWGQGDGYNDPPCGWCVITATVEASRNCRDDCSAEQVALAFFCEAADVSEDMIPEWNDHPSRTLADVLAAFDRAIEMSEEETSDD